MVTGTDVRGSVLAILDTVHDPEIPVLTIADIGILRDVEVADDGGVVVSITPTYSGCPAMDQIEEDILDVLGRAGYRASVRMTFTPPWTTDWMSDEARAKLAEFGIAPPESELGVIDEVLCPRCAASSSRVIAEFASTACKRMLVCTSCREPFDQFKAI
jgi:ring-1,2-phenylacetyl-CoA epoxidase subunit PaaD